MFVVFEGIDGSGKTTVSNRVAAELRRRGRSVEHVRERGEFASRLVSRMRAFGKDTRNLSMAPLTELLFYAARDAQLLAENIRPALDRGGLVFADRYLYSYEVLSHWGRGVPLDRVRPVIDSVAGGVWPDLVVLMDVDPHIARARRKVSKIKRRARGGRGSGGSRKGLGGVGMQHRLRAGYLAIAEREPERWLVVDNSDPEVSLDDVVARVSEAIDRLAAGTPAAALSSPRSRRRAPQLNDELEAGRDRFYALIEERAAAEPAVAAYLLSGLADEPAYQWRRRLAAGVPHLVAYGLRGLGDESAWVLRDELADTAPFWVARSLDGVEGARADAMRLRFVDTQPEAVLGTLGGLDTAAAWRLRERLAGDYPAQVLASTRCIDSERAWALLGSYLESAGGIRAVDQPEVAATVAGSLRGIGGERAWRLRRRCFAAAPVAVLRSLTGLTDEPSWELRREHADRAAKVVMTSLSGIDDPRAWELRLHHAPRVKEALDSMSGLDGRTAWTIRDSSAHIWPSTVVKSLGPLAHEPRGDALARRLLVEFPTNISLLKHVARIAADRLASSGGHGQETVHA